MSKIENKLFQTPILFLIFNRINVTQEVFNQIRKIKPKYLYVAADGPRDDKKDDQFKCDETRKIIDQIDWDCELKTLYRNKNLGCGPAVHKAITWFFDNVNSGIILEDDCFPNLTFFPYCEELLNKYQDVDTVKLIGGNNFQNNILRGGASYYYSHYPTSWGWATWRRSWQLFNSDISNSALEIRNGSIDFIFNSKKEKNHWAKSLLKASKESQTVWDFHFYYAIWKSKGICITPNQNLVMNIGFFENGTHYFLNDSTRTSTEAESLEFPLIHPEAMQVNRDADQYTFDHLYSHSLQRALRLLKENRLTSIADYLKNRIKERLNASK